MTGKRRDLQVQSRNSSHGVSLAGQGVKDLDGAEVETLIFPVQEVINHTNDNYCVTPPSSCQIPVEDKTIQTVHFPVQDSLSCQEVVKLTSLNKVQRHSNQTVSCHVVCHVPSVISRGHPQKKGVRPVVAKKEIKYVKDASFVNPCLFAKSVPNVPNVAKELGVGGRLQKFWPK